MYLYDFSDLQLAINLWYSEWLKTHDPFEDDFAELIKFWFPDYLITYDVPNANYIITGKLPW